MGLIFEILKALGEGEIPKEKEKRLDRERFAEESKLFGLSKDEMEDCKRSGMTPEEWAEENDPDYKD